MTITNIMVATARKNFSESEETTLPLLIPSSQEETEPAVLCCKT